MGFITNEIPASLTEYNAYRDSTPRPAFATHVRAYNLWWAQNVPYIDVPEPAIKKNIYYRWWLMRFNNLDADIPGQTFQFPTSVEGALGYNNAIALTQPMHIDDLKYLRNPIYAYGDWLSVGQVSKSGRFLDNPGDPENWSNSYTQYIAEAAWQSYQIHGGQPGIAGNLARYAEGDVKGQLAFYDHDNNEHHRVRLGCADRQRRRRGLVPLAHAANLDRAEARVPVQRRARRGAGVRRDRQHQPRPPRCARSPTGSRTPIINVLWNPSRTAARAPARGHQHAVDPWKEINNYYPFAVGLMPNTDQYKQALRLFDDPAEYPIFPFYTANQARQGRSAAAGSAGQQQLLHHQLHRAVPAALLGAAQLPQPVDQRGPTTRSCCTGTPGRSTSTATPSGRTPTSSGPTGTATVASTTAPGSTTTSSAAATGRSSRTSPVCGRATTTRSSCRRSTSAGPTSPSTTSATATPT